jgi:hypothetical protein
MGYEINSEGVDMQKKVFAFLSLSVILILAACTPSPDSGVTSSPEVTIAPEATMTSGALEATATQGPVETAPPTIADDSPVGGGQFPTGTYRCDDCGGMNWKPIYWSFDDSGTYHQEQVDNPNTIDGTWTVDGNEISVQDCFCDCSVVGVYTWSFDGEILRFTLIEDSCSDRIGFMNKSWFYDED